MLAWLPAMRHNTMSMEDTYCGRYKKVLDSELSEWWHPHGAPRTASGCCAQSPALITSTELRRLLGQLSGATGAAVPATPRPASTQP